MVTEANEAAERAIQARIVRADRILDAREGRQAGLESLLGERDRLRQQLEFAGDPTGLRIAQYRQRGQQQINALTAFTQADEDFINVLRQQHNENVDLFTRIVRASEETADNTRQSQRPLVVRVSGAINDQFFQGPEFQRAVVRANIEAQRDGLLGG